MAQFNKMVGELAKVDKALKDNIAAIVLAAEQYGDKYGEDIETGIIARNDKGEFVFSLKDCNAQEAWFSVEFWPECRPADREKPLGDDLMSIEDVYQFILDSQDWTRLSSFLWD